LMLALAEDAPPVPLPDEEVAATAEAEAEIGRGERVPSETVQAFWR
jgi:hypothetical protein